MTLIKFCGFLSVQEAQTAARLGVDAIGLNFYPKSKRWVDFETATRIVEGLAGANMIRVGVFVNADEKTILQTVGDLGLEQIQLHGDESPKLVRRLAPKAYKAFRVEDETVLTRIRFYPKKLFLLDAYGPDEYGGAGKTFRWEIAREAGRLGRVILAGGLTPENVGEAIEKARPAMVDVASGIESAPGVKDEGKMRAFLEAVREADAKIAAVKSQRKPEE